MGDRQVNRNDKVYEDFVASLFTTEVESELLSFEEEFAKRLSAKDTDPTSPGMPMLTDAPQANQSPNSAELQRLSLEAELKDAHYNAYHQIKQYLGSRKLHPTYGAGGGVVEVEYDSAYYALSERLLRMYAQFPQKGRNVFDYVVAESDYPACAEKLSIKEQLVFTEQKHVTLSPFAFWLLQGQDPMGYGEVVSPRVNHRRTNQSTFKHEGTNFLLRGSTASHQQWLQNGIMVSMPYCLAAPSKDIKEARLKLESTTTFHWNSDGHSEYQADSTKFHMGIEVKNISIKQPTYEVYKGLAGFFGYHVHPLTSPVTTYDGKVDLHLLMSRLSDVKITSIDVLNQVLIKMCFPFRYKEPKDNDGENLVRAFVHFAAIFRFVTPLRLAQLEGGHRTFLLNRVLQGYSNFSTVPLQVSSPEHRGPGTIPISGTLVDPLPLTLVYTKHGASRPKIKGVDAGSYGLYIVESDLEQAIQYSIEAQSFREKTFRDNYGTVLRSTVENVMADDPFIFFKDTTEYWELPAEAFFKEKTDGKNFGYYLSRKLRIAILQLFGSKFWTASSGADDTKTEAMRNEALTAFATEGKTARLFAKKIISAPMAFNSAKMGLTTYIQGKMQAALKQKNQSNTALWVLLWLIKTSLADETTFSVLHDFVGHPKMQPLLHINWLHDSIIVPIENIVRHHFDGGSKEGEPEDDDDNTKDQEGRKNRAVRKGTTPKKTTGKKKGDALDEDVPPKTTKRTKKGNASADEDQSDESYRAKPGKDKAANRRHKLLAYFKAKFLHMYLTSLMKLDLPLRFLDDETDGQDNDDRSKDALAKRDVVYSSKENADLLHILDQQKKAGRLAGEYPDRHLGALCLLYGLYLRGLDNEVSKDIIKAIHPKTGKLVQDTVSGKKRFVSMVNILTVVDDNENSLLTFIRRKTYDEQGRVPFAFTVERKRPVGKSGSKRASASAKKRTMGEESGESDSSHDSDEEEDEHDDDEEDDQEDEDQEKDDKEKDDEEKGNEEKDGEQKVEDENVKKDAKEKVDEETDTEDDAGDSLMFDQNAVSSMVTLFNTIKHLTRSVKSVDSLQAQLQQHLPSFVKLLNFVLSHAHQKTLKGASVEIQSNGTVSLTAPGGYNKRNHDDTSGAAKQPEAHDDTSGAPQQPIHQPQPVAGRQTATRTTSPRKRARDDTSGAPQQPKAHDDTPKKSKRRHRS